MITRATDPTTDQLGQLRERLALLRDRLVSWEARLVPEKGSFPAGHLASARNLAHYLALRSEDLRAVQSSLTALGLSSLGRSEGDVIRTLDSVLAVLDRLVPGGDPELLRSASLEDRHECAMILAQRTAELFGPAPEGRSVRIMVTAPDEAAYDRRLVLDLLAAGTNCLRINCARGDPELWRRMIDNVRAAEAELGRNCKVLMDLAGPRARTGPIQTGPAVLKIRPQRDRLGWVVKPAEIWIASEEKPAAPPALVDASVLLPERFLSRLDSGDRLTFRDARDARRELVVTATSPLGVVARLEQTAYLLDGTRVRHRRAGSRRSKRWARIRGIAPVEQRIRLYPGDRLLMTRDQVPGQLPLRDETRGLVAPATVPIVPPEVLGDVRVGEPVWIDDGRIGGRITSVDHDRMEVAITSASPHGTWLGPSRAINLPDSDLRFPSLTERDLAILPFIAENADLVGYSFIRQAADLQELYRRLHGLRGRRPGVVLKIETRKAFEELPSILLEALRHRAVGVMIARGDLAVECGFERLAEVQEEILWLCEAAHLPVIWATQVLEGMAKQGLASRAEITDAAVAERAECVMLNKGPFIVDAVRSLDDILRRMKDHQRKKQSLLRHLKVVDRVAGEGNGNGNGCETSEGVRVRLDPLAPPEDQSLLTTSA